MVISESECTGVKESRKYTISPLRNYTFATTLTPLKIAIYDIEVSVLGILQHGRTFG